MSVVISPNMNLPVPVVGEDPGPAWATNINSSLSIIDQHTHSAGSGVPITPDGLNINAALSMQNNNLFAIRSTRFTSQSATLSLPDDLDCLYVVDQDLYYNDGAGNKVRITQGGSVTGSSGTITGLPSGTASASYGAGTFTFQSATLTPATMAVGPLVIGRSVASSKTVELTPNAAQANNYSLTLPVALPASVNYLTLDNTGVMSFNTSGSSGSGAVVLATSASLTTATLSGATLSGTTTNSGTISGGTVAATTLTGAGSGITALNMNNAASGTLAVVRGGTGVTTDTGSGAIVKQTSPTISGATLSGATAVSGTFTLPTSGGTASDLNFYQTQTVSISFAMNNSGNSGSASIAFTRIGNMVVCNFLSTYSATSNASDINFSSASGAVPSWARPSAISAFMLAIFNTASSPSTRSGRGQIASNGTFTVQLVDGAVFSAGTTTLGNYGFSYLV